MSQTRFLNLDISLGLKKRSGHLYLLIKVPSDEEYIKQKHVDNKIIRRY